MTTFAEQSQMWLRDLEERKRKPVSRATIRAFSAYVKVLVALIGDVALVDVNNGTAKAVVATLCQKDYSPKTVNEILGALKFVVASAVDPNTGEQLYPRVWNSKHIDAPVVTAQKQPCLTCQEVESLIAHAKSDQKKLFYSVLAGTGLRVSESLGIHVSGAHNQTSWDKNSSAIHVRSSMYRDQEQERLKTPAGQRVLVMQFHFRARRRNGSQQQSASSLFILPGGNSLRHS